MRATAKATVEVPRAHRAVRPAKVDDTISSLLRDLGQAARGEDVAWAISNAMDTVDNHFRRQVSEPLSIEQRDGLLIVIARAEAAAVLHLPPHYGREQISAGMQAMAAQVMVWAESPERTADRPEHFVADTCAYARMFRNDLHNMSIVEDIQNRARDRRQVEIDRLKVGAAHGKGL